MRRVVQLLCLALVTGACSAAGSGASTTTSGPVPTTGEPAGTTTTTTDPSDRGLPFPEAPDVPDGPLDSGTVATLERIWDGLPNSIDPDDVRALGDAGDARVAWLIADLLRFAGSGEILRASTEALLPLTGVEFTTVAAWVGVTDHLIAWDLPAPPGYGDWKRRLFTAVDARWDFVFAQPSAIDLRLLSWGGVFIDDRPLGDDGPCERGCIPALDDPGVTDAAGGDWYPDDAIVFGVVVGDESRAYPKNIMEIHEMVNDTLGGRRIGFPYCTLCGSAQVFLTDEVEGFDEPVLRTSGLLSRSNKVMYELGSLSVFDTFTGEAVAGPMLEAGVTLPQVTVVTSSWAEWKAAHPDTTIVASDGGIGRFYTADPLGGRDDNGPIFPIGDRDLRLPVQEQVVGVVLPDGTAVAFPAFIARRALDTGEVVELAGVTLHPDAGGLRATFQGEELPSHQAFWFAWSQFHPDTLLWEP